ncbi:MAG TPA: hypothetical protein PLH49_03630 [Chitinophagaceae bacterium]|jgi:hypothetical protein|nr:hypothetical protein [Chitinophagaceae bacterium]
MFETGAPLVESISGYRIVKLGFVKAETTILPETQTVQTVYRRGDDIIAYNGYKWFFNGKPVQFINEITNHDNTTK